MRRMASPKRYAVASCHVERPLDDRVWARFAALQHLRPGGFAIAALIRPPDPDAGEDAGVWLARAREAAGRGPLGHHTHWTAPDHARPTDDLDPAARVRGEGAWLRERDLRPTLFCGGGWYSDLAVAEACAELGYVDCTATAYRPGYLPPGAQRLGLRAPARVVLPSGSRLLELPSTHSLGMLAREVLTFGGLGSELVHVHFHDTDLVDERRRLALVWALRALARRRQATDLDVIAARLRDSAAEIPFKEIVTPAT
jgi:hypothetical protein